MIKRVTETITLLSVGDVRISNKDPRFILELVRPTLSVADITTCQLETVYSNKGARDPHARIPFRAAPEDAAELKDAGFDVITTAGNHCMDYGHEALLDTIDVLRAAGLAPLGTGRNLEEAEKPVIVERGGNRVGFLSYNSIMAEEWCAQSDRPGCNPIKIYSSDGQFNAGETAAGRRPDTAPGRADLDRMAQSIERLKGEADIAVVSFHWGLALSPADFAGYQRELGHAAIDAGADLVLGHHPHILKAVEIYKEKVIFYSIGNFAFDQSAPLSAAAQALSPGYKDDPDYPGYKFPIDTRKAILVKCSIDEGRIQRISVLPAYINSHAQPHLLARDDARFDEVVDYLKKVTKDHGMPADFAIDGAEAVIWG